MHNELAFFSRHTLLRILKISQELLDVGTVYLGEKAIIRFQSFLIFLRSQCEQYIQQQVEYGENEGGYSNIHINVQILLLAITNFFF